MDQATQLYLKMRLPWSRVLRLVLSIASVTVVVVVLDVVNVVVRIAFTWGGVIS